MRSRIYLDSVGEEVGTRDILRLTEIRGRQPVSVALEMGSDSSAATLHANSAADVPARFAALGALAGLPAAAVTSLVSSGVDLVLHLHRGRDGRRRLVEVALLEQRDDALVTVPAWTSDGRVLPGADLLTARLAARGVQRC